MLQSAQSGLSKNAIASRIMVDCSASSGKRPGASASRVQRCANSNVRQPVTDWRSDRNHHDSLGARRNARYGVSVPTGCTELNGDQSSCCVLGQSTACITDKQGRRNTSGKYRTESNTLLLSPELFPMPKATARHPCFRRRNAANSRLRSESGADFARVASQFQLPVSQARGEK